MAGKPGCGGQKGRSGRKAGLPTHVVRMPLHVTPEWVQEVENVLAVLSAYKAKAKGKDTRNYVELNRLLKELSEQSGIDF